MGTTRRAPDELRVLEYEELRALSPYEFEEAVATLFRDLGFRKVRRCGGSGDLSVDIECVSEKDEKVVVQCKRYAPGNNIGSKEIQTFLGMAKIHHRADFGFFVTTSSFTQAARALGDQHVDLTLVDGPALAEMVARARGKVPGKRPSAMKALRKAGYTPQSLVDKWWAEEAAAGRQLPSSGDDVSCQCMSSDRIWIAFRDDRMRLYLICPVCARCATDKEVADADEPGIAASSSDARLI